MSTQPSQSIFQTLNSKVLALALEVQLSLEELEAKAVNYELEEMQQTMVEMWKRREQAREKARLAEEKQKEKEQRGREEEA